jgi:pyruvate dehydrogenase E2 component (dihydrolipoamide acetyltransferase)
MAAELGIDLAKVAGSGVGGVITKADDQAAAQAAASQAAAAQEAAPRDRAASMRRAIAAAMARSKREIPHYYLATTIDMSRALVWLAAENSRRSVEDRVLPAALLLKAVALALREVPELNGLWVDGAFQPSAAIHLGVAVSLRGGGLIAPAIHDADQKSLGELMAALRDLVQRARAGSLRSSEVSDPTITVTNLGEQGVETVFGVIYPPQVALVGLGKIVEKPWVEKGMLGARPVLTATLSADHRVSDGHRGALFLAALDRLLQAPEKL